MSRFKYASSTTVGGKTISVMGRDEGSLTKMTNILGDDLKLAQDLLQRTDAQLHAPKLSKDVLKYAHRYFLTPADKIDTGDLQKMQSVITLVVNGMGSDMTIKVGKNVGGNDKDVHGSVRQTKKDSSKSYHTSVVDLDDGETWRMGAMRIDESTLETKRLGVVTLVHEATHKYAGTNDYCYFKDNSREPNGAFTDKNEALKNADSYAWFVLKVGRAWHDRRLYA
jgi:hypothetical protein